MSAPGFPQFLRENAAFLLAGMLLTFTSSFGQTFFIAVFAGEIMAEFGLSDGQWGLIYSLGTAVSAGVMVWAGVLTDRLRVRHLGVFTLTGLAVACLAMAANPTVLLLPVVVFLLRFTGQGMTSHLAVVAMARWFVATRGRALAIAAMGFALGEAVLPVGFVWALGITDWRFLWVICAGLVLLVLPVLLRLLRQERTPQSLAQDAQTFGMGGAQWTRRQMFRHPLFWFVLPSILGPSAFVTAMFFQQVHLTEVKGWPHVSLVALFPLFTAVSVVSLAISGWVIDRIGTARLMPLFQLPLVAAFLVMSQADTLIGAAVAFSLMGISVGANSTLPAAFWAEFYGTRHLGGIKSIATAVMVLGSALGPAITGSLIDLGYSFPQQMWGIAAYSAVRLCDDRDRRLKSTVRVTGCGVDRRNRPRFRRVSGALRGCSAPSTPMAGCSTRPEPDVSTPRVGSGSGLGPRGGAPSR